MRPLLRRIATLILLALPLAAAAPLRSADGPSRKQPPAPDRVGANAPAAEDDAERVGQSPDGRGWIAPTKQVLRPAGRAIEYAGRPVDLVLAPGGRRLYVKDDEGLVAINREGWKIMQELAFQKAKGKAGGKIGGSMHGIAISADGARVFATTAQDSLDEATVGVDGSLAWSRRIELPGPVGKDASKSASHACGIALSTDGTTAYVCLSRNNTLARIFHPPFGGQRIS